ncbi:hypothetical protein MJM28_30200, partial [Salmonella enterica subsp. enterica serovar Montevideo]|nr:hypothetical protein [Salmonella enterica subsp. enterica serovar Montevideo]
IELCFPTLSREEREKLIAENFHSLGMALLETGMAWFWPDSRVPLPYLLQRCRPGLHFTFYFDQRRAFAKKCAAKTRVLPPVVFL